MNDKTHFSAPWGVPLLVMTTLSIVILIGIPVLYILFSPPKNIYLILGMIILPLIILFISVFFIIRGYILTPEAIFIQRLCWKNKLDLTDIVSAGVDPNAMDKSIRTFGNGGMFCFAGAFYNKRLSSYRAFATDPKLSVVLKFKNRTVVVTPDKPSEFVEKINRILIKRNYKSV